MSVLLSHALRGARLGLSLLAAGGLALFSQGAGADLSIVGTRFVYPAGLSVLTIRVGNVGSSPLLLQAWLDKGDAAADPSLLAVPFVLSPPISRLDPQQRAALSVRYSGEPLPGDRESVFWINFLEVPSLIPLSGNQLRLAYRFRMKLLYRPKDLPGIADEAVQQVRWSLYPGAQGADLTLKAINPTPYYVSLVQLSVGDDSQSINFKGVTVEPFGTTQLPLPGVKAMAAGQAQVRYQVVIDSGETLSGRARIHP